MSRDRRGGLRLLSELGHPEAALPGTLSVTGDSARSDSARSLDSAST